MKNEIEYRNGKIKSIYLYLNSNYFKKVKNILDLYEWNFTNSKIMTFPNKSQFIVTYLQKKNSITKEKQRLS